jgi:hypothetical protein
MKWNALVLVWLCFECVWIIMSVCFPSSWFFVVIF